MCKNGNEYFPRISEKEYKSCINILGRGVYMFSFPAQMCPTMSQYTFISGNHYVKTQLIGYRQLLQIDQLQNK